MMPPSRPYPSSMPPIAVRWQPPRILSEHLGPLPEPLACLLTPGPIDAPAAVAALGARALLDLAPLGSEGRAPWPAWLAPRSGERRGGKEGRSRWAPYHLKKKKNKKKVTY